MPLGMIRRPDQRPAFHKIKPFLQTYSFVLRKFIRMDIICNFQMHFGGL